MKDFTFYNPTRILFGPDKTAELSQIIPKNARILFCFDENAVSSNGAYAEIKKALASFTVIEFSGIQPNPDYEYLRKALPLIQAHQLNFIVSAGGGSVIDGAKFIAAAACSTEDPWMLTAEAFLVKQALPHICVLTLPGAGSEMNCWSVVSRRELHLKRDLSGEALYPVASILDPKFTLTLPDRQITNGIIDAFSHVIEQYVTLENDTPLQDRQAKALAQTIIDSGRAIVKNKQDLAARGHFMWAACLALNDHLQTGLIPDFAAHRISHALTALYYLDHGQSMALILPATLSVLREMKQTKLLQFAKEVWGLEGDQDQPLIEAAIQHTRTFFLEVGASLNPQDYDLEPSMIPDILSYLRQEHTYPLGECHPIMEKEVKAILEEMFKPVAPATP